MPAAPSESTNASDEILGLKFVLGYHARSLIGSAPALREPDSFTADADTCLAATGIFDTHVLVETAISST